MSNKTGVVYIQRDKFDIYSPVLNTVLEFRYVAEIIKDLDVINKNLLEEIIKLFIERSQIPAAPMIFVMADNACFIKDFTADPNQVKDSPQEQAKKFIEHTPFDNVSSKTFVIPGGVRVFATNKDLFRFIKSAFEKQGFKVEAVVPGFLIGNNMSLQPSLTPQMANYALLKANSVRQYNLLTEQKVVETVKKDDAEEEEEQTGGKKSESSTFDSSPEGDKQTQTPDKKRLYALVGVFTFLILFTVVFYFIMYPPK